MAAVLIYINIYIDQQIVVLLRTLRLPAGAVAAVLATDGLWGVLDETGGSEEAARLVRMSVGISIIPY